MILNRLLNYIKPYKKSFIFIILIVITSSIISIFIPKILGDFITEIYESVSNKNKLNNNYLYTLLIILSSLYLINILLNYLENYLTRNTTQNALYHLKKDTNKKLSKLRISYYDTHSKGDLLSRFNNDIETISTLYMNVFPKILNYSITFIGTLIMMFYIDSFLTSITIIALPLIVIFSKLLLSFSKKKQQQYVQKLGYLNSVIIESYLNKELISLYNNDKLIGDNFNKLNKDLAKTHIKSSLITGLLSPLSSLINYIVYLLILIIGAKHVFEGKIKFGEIQSLIQYTKQIGTPINSVSSLLSQIQNALIAGKRVIEILDEKEEATESNDKLNEIESIEFKNVNFSYSSNYPLIKNLNLKINKGEKIAIVGETGSGKSTIINILMQFYKINNGEILINNKSIYKYNLNDYYTQISLVTQDMWLLNDSIRNNLKYGNLEASDENILNTCQKTQCLELINKSPNKLDQVVEENAQNISEGEKQLLTITRALLKPHSLLILDEATSNIDTKTEKQIEEALKNTDKNKTTLIIAHRLSTITNSDKIIVIKDGQIIESGTHKSLYKEKGEYYKFIQAL